MNWTAGSSGHLDDTTEAVWTHVKFLWRCFNHLPLDGILSFYETPEGLHELENITSDSIDIEEFWVIYSFKTWVNNMWLIPEDTHKKKKKKIKGATQEQVSYGFNHGLF